MRRSASLAISRARRRARSERPPSASAWMRQAILRKRNCLWFDRDCSPNTSRYFCLSWPTVILARSSICFFIAVATSFSFLKAVNLVSMRARCRRTIKWRLASALGAEPEVAGGKKAGDGLKILGRNGQDESPRYGMAPTTKVRLAVVQRLYLVEQAVPPVNPGDSTLIRLSCVDDDAQGQPLEVLWDRRRFRRLPLTERDPAPLARR